MRRAGKLTTRIAQEVRKAGRWEGFADVRRPGGQPGCSQVDPAVGRLLRGWQGATRSIDWEDGRFLELLALLACRVRMSWQFAGETWLESGGRGLEEGLARARRAV